MKFVQLPVGSRFEYRGQSYLKTSPLVATNEAMGGQQLIARSADVLPLDRGSTGKEARGMTRMLSRSEVESAFMPFYQECLELLQEQGRQDSPTEALEQARARLEQARTRFFDRLKR